MIRISSLARWEPRQKWGPPPPKVMWSLGERPTSKRNGSSNTDSSRFAEMYQMTTLSPSAIAWPAISVSCVAVRLNDMTGVAHRSISSMPVGSSDGSSSSRCRWSGCSMSACMPWEIRLRVVSLPATESSRKKRSNCISSSRSPSTSACSSTLTMSSPGFARFSSPSRLA